MIIIAGTIDFASAEAREACLKVAVPFQESTRTTEPGCLAYSFAPDSGSPTRVQVFELWEDESSLAAHFEHPNFIAMGQALRDFERVGASTAKYRCDLSEPVRDSEGRPRADFFTAES
jgi:quinol monooxygenase YgiN